MSVAAFFSRRSGVQHFVQWAAVGAPLRPTFRGLSTCIDLRSDHQERVQALPVV
jgi:hypothetical protein